MYPNNKPNEKVSKNIIHRHISLNDQEEIRFTNYYKNFKTSTNLENKETKRLSKYDINNKCQ